MVCILSSLSNTLLGVSKNIFATSNVYLRKAPISDQLLGALADHFLWPEVLYSDNNNIKLEWLTKSYLLTRVLKLLLITVSTNDKNNVFPDLAAKTIVTHCIL